MNNPPITQLDPNHIFCMFCGARFPVSKPPTQTEISHACDHESQCPHNPYLAELVMLRATVEQQKTQLNLLYQARQTVVEGLDGLLRRLKLAGFYGHKN